MPFSAFYENTSYNCSLARSKSKPKKRVGMKIVTAKEVLERLASAGINTTERTLQRYVKAGLIPAPERRSAGRGKGKITDYPDSTPSEFYASHTLQHDRFLKLKQDDAAIVRTYALGAIEKSKNVLAKAVEQNLTVPKSVLDLDWHIGPTIRERYKDISEDEQYFLYGAVRKWLDCYLGFTKK